MAKTNERILTRTALPLREERGLLSLNSGTVVIEPRGIFTDSKVR